MIKFVLKSGEKVPASSPMVSGSAKNDGVGKLDSSAYKPFGSATSINMSRSASDTSDSSSEDATCRGGPGKINCGKQVLHGDKAVQCDRCKSWFHMKCQAIPKLAHDALVKYKCLSWLCDKCKQTITDGCDCPTAPSQPEKETNVELKRLERKVEDVGESMRTHMKIIVQSIKEQEKIVIDSTKLMERSYRDQHTQKSSYADMVRGTCEKVVKEVTAKIDTLPKQRENKDVTETTKVMSQVFDSFMDKEKRKLNVVVHNLPEPNGNSFAERAEQDQQLFTKVIKDSLNLIVRPTRTFRVGRKMGEKPRLLIVSLENTDTKAEILKMAPEIRHHPEWSRIFVTPDLSKKEREEGKRLREELHARKEAGEENLTIRKGKIIKIQEKRVPNPSQSTGAASSSEAGGSSGQAAPAPAPAHAVEPEEPVEPPTTVTAATRTNQITDAHVSQPREGAKQD